MAGVKCFFVLAASLLWLVQAGPVDVDGHRHKKAGKEHHVKSVHPLHAAVHQPEQERLPEADEYQTMLDEAPKEDGFIHGEERKTYGDPVSGSELYGSRRDYQIQASKEDLSPADSPSKKEPRPRQAASDAAERSDDPARKNEEGLPCDECQAARCPKVDPMSCPAGVVKDRCGCCDVCAQKEWQLCNVPGVAPGNRYYGTCGKNLQCTLRNDVDANRVGEAICLCMNDESLCGSDGKTYKNLCALMEHARLAIFEGNEKVIVKSKGPCKSAPVITAPPEHAHNNSGSNIYLACEGVGYPIPTIEWMWTRVDKKSMFMPSDDDHISVLTRGGPEKYQVTGWLQIMNLQSRDEGDYTCIVQNEMGRTESTARVTVRGLAALNRS